MAFLFSLVEIFPLFFRCSGCRSGFNLLVRRFLPLCRSFANGGGSQVDYYARSSLVQGEGCGRVFRRFISMASVRFMFGDGAVAVSQRSEIGGAKKFAKLADSEV